MKPGAHEHDLRPALQYHLWYTALSFKKRKKERISEKVLASPGLRERRDRESIELRLGLETDNSALHHIRTFGAYQEMTAVKRIAHTFAVEIGIHFWLSGGS